MKASRTYVLPPRVMDRSKLYTIASSDRYSAKKMSKPVNFFCTAPDARAVSVVGDFNAWDPKANVMRRGPDGAWHTQVSLHHGHHQYCFLVDGASKLDPRAQGIATNVRNEKVSLMSVS